MRAELHKQYIIHQQRSQRKRFVKLLDKVLRMRAPVNQLAFEFSELNEYLRYGWDNGFKKLAMARFN